MDGGILVFWGNQIFESLRSSNIMVSLKIPTPTPAPDCTPRIRTVFGYTPASILVYDTEAYEGQEYGLNISLSLNITKNELFYLRKIKNLIYE